MTDRTREEGYRFDNPDNQRYWTGLLDACELLWGHYNGSSDGVSDEAHNDLVNFLEYRLSHWQISTKTTERYDEAVRSLILAVLDMSIRKNFERGEVRVLVDVKRRCGNCSAFVYKGTKPWCHFSNAPTGPLDCCNAWEWEKADKKDAKP
jgi:hypothetical protein